MSVGEADRKGRSIIIACRVMEPELTHVVSERNEADDCTDILYLEQALHRTPGRLLMKVQEKIDQVARTATRIVLGYGLCAKGVVGITARASEVIIPRCHDCIALFLGCPNRYLEIFRKKPGTYYLTPGWLADHQDPLGLIEEHIPRLRPGDGSVGDRRRTEALHPYRPDRYGGGGNGALKGAGDGERRRSEKAV